jgi:glycosyltransferase involved in cell wall biosynthesis
MKAYYIDISGTVPGYDIALCEAMTKHCDDNLSVHMFCPLYTEKTNCRLTKLINLVPFKYRTKTHPLKRYVKAIELFLNYFLITVVSAIKRPDVIHLQWLPLIEYTTIEARILHILKYVSGAKLVLTIHNIHPHDISEDNKAKYESNFKKVAENIDYFITHTLSSKEDVIRVYNLDAESIYVIHHGVFVPKEVPQKQKSDKLVFLLFGVQSAYKGADLLVDAIRQLTKKDRERIQVVIAGKTDETLYERCKTEAEALGIRWINHFVDESSLYQLISNSDVVVFPYRKISQSGALLLTLYFNKMMILSDLPSFMETVGALPDYCFFSNGDSTSLSNRISMLLDGGFDKDNISKILSELKQQYSWDNAAQKTILMYKNIE